MGREFQGEGRGRRREFGEAGGDLGTGGFVSEQKNFELDLLRDREPVEVLEDKGDEVCGLKLHPTPLQRRG